MIRVRRAQGLPLELALWGLALLFLVPLITMVNIAFRDQRAPADPLALTLPPTLDNLVEAWTTSPLGASMLNSAVITISTVLLSIAVGAIAAYPLARSARAWSKTTYYFFLAGLLVPGQLGLLPLYQTMRDVGLLGTIPGLVLVHLGGSLAFTIFLFTTFLRDLPIEYEEAALLDGCGPIRTFLLVVFPLLRPVIGSVAILTAVSTWNAYLVPLLYVGASGFATVPVTIATFVGQFSTNYPVIFSGILITVLPLLIGYFLLQKTVIQGFASGLKG